jgi:hypothetical protein
MCVLALAITSVEYMTLTIWAWETSTTRFLLVGLTFGEDGSKGESHILQFCVDHIRRQCRLERISSIRICHVDACFDPNSLPRSSAANDF